MSETLRNYWVAALVFSTPLACGSPERERTGQQEDLGTSPPGTPPPADPSDPTDPTDPFGDHASYIPPGYPPVAAKRLLVLGDSISTGSGLAAPDANGYFSLLFDDDGTTTWAEPFTDLTTLYGVHTVFRQLALDGATTAKLSQGVRSELPTLFSQKETWPPAGHTVAVMTIGGNDVAGALLGNLTGAVLNSAVANIRSTVEFLQDPQNFPDGVSIFLATVYDPTDGENHAPGCYFDVTVAGLAAALDVWRERYVALATEMQFAVVDTLGHFRGHGWNHGNTQNPYYDAEDPSRWFSDCVHPDPRGHHELRRLFFAALSTSYAVE